MEIDYKAMLNNFLNMSLLKEESIRPVVEVLNKYGITGMDAISCMLELGQACNNIDGDKSNE